MSTALSAIIWALGVLVFCVVAVDEEVPKWRRIVALVLAVVGAYAFWMVVL